MDEVQQAALSILVISKDDPTPEDEPERYRQMAKGLHALHARLAELVEQLQPIAEAHGLRVELAAADMFGVEDDPDWTIAAE
jgi:hypothetical protein